MSTIHTPTVGELCTTYALTAIGADEYTDFPVKHITLNAQQSQAQGIFAALPGTHNHGAQFIDQAKAAIILTDKEGAQIIEKTGDTRPILIAENLRGILGYISADIYGNPTEDMCVIGITGTSGKTTTTYLIESILRHVGLKTGIIGTTGTRINGQPLHSELTTPEAPRLQEICAHMKKEGCTHLVMEVSSHAISLGRINGTHFNVRGFSNLSQDHLDYHHTMEEYFETKASFFTNKAEESVITIDDQWGKKLAQRLGPTCHTVSTNTTEQEAEFSVDTIDVHKDGSQVFQVRRQAEGKKPVSWHVALDLPGHFNVQNATLALACTTIAGIPLSSAISALAHTHAPGRMEKIDRGQDFLALVDYAHKPAAVSAVLNTLRSQVRGRIAIVLGAGGDRDRTKRPLMGKAAVQGADFLIITDDNPRSEDPALIRKEILEGAEQASKDPHCDHPIEIEEYGDRAEAIARAVHWARPGDAIIIAGKGHETGQEVNGHKTHFDDREELAAAIDALMNEQH